MSISFVPTVMSSGDLDGWSPQQLEDEFAYSMAQGDANEFGFDPAPKMHNFSHSHQGHESMFTPPNDLNFEFDPVPNTMAYPVKYESRALPLSDVVPAAVSNGASVSRYGQVTPPRSNSESSVSKTEEKSTRQRRSTKGSIKEEIAKAQPGRKRRNIRKDSIVVSEDLEDDDKRKQSLEKNRLAAAKCRVNKKEKTEQLQRDSHEMAMTNAYLKDTVMRMKEEVQQMNALLLSHAKCEGCKSPEDISKHLSDLGNEFLAARMHMSHEHIHHEPYSIPDISLDSHTDIDHENYFSPASDTSMMHPPLPEFDRDGAFDVTTPMKLD